MLCMYETSVGLAFYYCGGETNVIRYGWKNRCTREQYGANDMHVQHRRDRRCVPFFGLESDKTVFPFFHMKETRQSTERMAMVLILPSSLTVNGEKNGPPAKIAESTFESSRSPRHGCVCVCAKRLSLSLSLRAKTAHARNGPLLQNYSVQKRWECTYKRVRQRSRHR